jgi:YD repeat-containing protein
MEQRTTVKAGLLAATAAAVFGMQPTVERDTLFNVDGSGSRLLSTQYSDAVGRTMQEKLRLSPTIDRVSCVFYDKFGRSYVTTMPFSDSEYPGKFLPGAISDQEWLGDAGLRNQLKASYSGDERAFSVTAYWDDQLGRARSSVGPGMAYKSDSSMAWTFGVRLDASPLDHDVPNPDPVYAGTTIGAVRFEKGFITKISTNGSAYVTMTHVLQALYAEMRSVNPFDGQPSAFLSVSRGADRRITEELKDIFGRTIATLSAPDSATTSGSKIKSEYKTDVLGNVLKTTPPKAVYNPVGDAECKYNTVGQLIWKRTPEGSVKAYTYRIDGQLESEEISTGSVVFRKIIYLYDDQGRRSSVWLGSTGTAKNERMHYYYDKVDAVKSLSIFSGIPTDCISRLTNLKGRLVGTIMVNDDPSNTRVGELFSYNDEGRIGMKLTVIGESSPYQETDYEYDIHGKVIAEKFYYSGDHIKKKFTYDELGRMKKVIQSVYNAATKTYTDKELTDNGYDQLGNPSLTTFTAVQPETYRVRKHFDVRGLLNGITSLGMKGLNESIGYGRGGAIDADTFTYKPHPTQASA